jgi:hypothetical protein
MENNQVDMKAIARYVYDMQRKEDNLIKYQLNTNEDLDQFKHDLLGESYDEETGEWVIDDTKMRMCNEKGANAITAHLRLHISRHVSLSNYPITDNIEMTSFYDIKSFLYFLVDNKNAFEFPSYTTISLVLSTIDKLNYSTLLKAVKGWQGDSLNKQYVHQETEERITNITPKQKLFGGIVNK